MPEERTYTAETRETWLDIHSRLSLEIRPTVSLWRLLATDVLNRYKNAPPELHGFGGADFMGPDAAEPLYALTVRLHDFLDELDGFLSIGPPAVGAGRNGGDDA